MTITYTLLNLSSETDESVNIKPFPRTAWVETDADSVPAAITSTEHRQAGEEVEAPLIRRTSIRNTNVLFPGDDRMTMKGRRFQCDIHTLIRREDSVNNAVHYIPITVGWHLSVGGLVIPVGSDVQKLLLSCLAEGWDSVVTGVPDTAVISKIALGSSDI